MNLQLVFKGPVLSEKAVSLVDKQQVYSFKVDFRMTKGDIKMFLKKHFEVDVTAINTSILAGKTMRKARSKKGAPIDVKKAKIKKVSVRLAAGQKLPTPADGLSADDVNRGPVA